MDNEIVFLTNVDSEVLSFKIGKETLFDPDLNVKIFKFSQALPKVDSAKVVVFRRLSNLDHFKKEFLTFRQSLTDASIDLIVIGGEKTPNASLEAYSTLDHLIVKDVSKYIRAGGPENLYSAFKVISNNCFGTNYEISEVNFGENIYLYRHEKKKSYDVAILFYLSQLVAKNVSYIDALIDEFSKLKISSFAIALYSLRDEELENELVSILAEKKVKLIISTLWASGNFSDNSWLPSSLSKLNVAIIQAITTSKSRDFWENYQLGLNPLDVTTHVAMPEFEGRIITVPFSFKEEVEELESTKEPVIAYRCDSERAAKITNIANRFLKLAKAENKDKKIAIVLSAYPSKKSRIGNAVGLDTARSLINIIKSLSARGYSVGDISLDPDKLMHKIADGFIYEDPRITSQNAEICGVLGVSEYLKYFETLDQSVKEQVIKAWGDPPGEVLVNEDGFVFCGIRQGNLVIAIQPPRGYGYNPIAIYHDPDLAPTHHYLAFYYFLEKNVDAIIHLGKHGTLEWLPGKSVGLSGKCFPDICSYSLPIIYPFIINDPGEGIQAKRRSHAVIIDHLMPALSDAQSHGLIVELEKLLDEHAKISLMSPDKLPMVREKIWSLIIDANIDKDLSLDISDPKSEELDSQISHIDGYICELKDAQIKVGLHVLGEAPEGEKLIDTIFSITKSQQGSIKPLAQSIKIPAKVKNKLKTKETQEINLFLKKKIKDALKNKSLRKSRSETINYIRESLVPNLLKTEDELSNILDALDAKFIYPGPAGAPSRGQAHVLPTGRNFYSIDPRTLPTPFSYEVGKRLAIRTLEHFFEKNKKYPKSVAIVVWGTSAIRTGGDDIAEALYLAGLYPNYDENSMRVISFEPIPLDELGRPRIEVTLRISGLFRDAFSATLEMLDAAFKKLEYLDEPEDLNPYAKKRDVSRIYGPKPGAYGSGILPLIDSGKWNSKGDLANVYLTWSSYAYGASKKGDFEPDGLKQRLLDSDVAVKNQDNREHDIFDSDDYMQDHGGLVATIEFLRGVSPEAIIGDSSDTQNPRVKDLKSEALKVLRTRVTNPKWIEAISEHGYKGAFEIAATVDYIFGYDATTGIVDDFMYEELVKSFIKDEKVKDFLKQSNPWALKSISERLLEAVSRNLWENPSQESVNVLVQTILECEAWEEDH